MSDTILNFMVVVIITAIITWYDLWPINISRICTPKRQNKISIGTEQIELINERITTLEYFNRMMEQLNRLELNMMRSKEESIQNLNERMEAMQQIYKSIDDKILNAIKVDIEKKK
eukprot:75439_1